VALGEHLGGLGGSTRRIPSTQATLGAASVASQTVPAWPWRRKPGAAEGWRKTSASPGVFVAIHRRAGSGQKEVLGVKPAGACFSRFARVVGMGGHDGVIHGPLSGHLNSRRIRSVQ
jgi:hypothetical protein